MLPNVSIDTSKHSDYEHMKCVNPTYEYSGFDLKRRPLPLRRKIIEFYTAPITKFLANSVSKIK